MAKKITKWEPEDFELEMTTHWSFPKRGDWATHDAKWRGNWSPYIPRNILLRYSKENDLVLDQFAGGGTTLVEAKLLNRNIIGVDVNDVALARCKEKTAFAHEGANGKVYLHKGDARNLDFVPDNSIDLICTHPPYADIIQYAKQATALEQSRLLNGTQLVYTQMELADKARDYDVAMQSIPSTIADLQTKFSQVVAPTENLVQNMRLLRETAAQYGADMGDREKVAIYERL